MKTYSGNCHCGNVSFSFEHPEVITSGLRCNCSLCKRKGALMTDFVIPPESFHIDLKNPDNLGLYEFDDKVGHHFFCKECGIYPFHQTVRMPDHYRANLGCIDEIDTDNIDATIFDGKDL